MVKTRNRPHRVLNNKAWSLEKENVWNALKLQLQHTFSQDTMKGSGDVYSPNRKAKGTGKPEGRTPEVQC